MKTINKLILTMAGFILLQAPAFCVDTTAPVDTLTQILQTVQDFETKALDYMKKTADGQNQQIADALNDIFVGKKVPASATLNSMDLRSVMDQKIDVYTRQFFSTYITKSFQDLNYLKDNIINMSNVNTLLSQEIGYNTQKNARDMFIDDNALLKLPFESPPNYNAASTTSPSPFGNLAPSAPKASDMAPNILDLIGKDTYGKPRSSDAPDVSLPKAEQEAGLKNEKDKARLFIRYMLQAVPPPRNFNIARQADGSLEMVVPLPSNDPVPLPYTTYSIAKDDIPAMLSYLNNEGRYYVPYKMKVRSMNVLRTLYTEGLIRAYQERVAPETGKGNQGGGNNTTSDLDTRSLIEKEKDMAFTGLNKAYYNKLLGLDESGKHPILGPDGKPIPPATVADVFLEALQAVNKLVYFVYKLHQDIERLTLIVSTSSMQLIGGQQDIQDEMNYIKPINALIKGACWLEKNKNTDSCLHPKIAGLKTVD